MVYNKNGIRSWSEELDKTEFLLTKERMKNELLMQALGEIETYDSTYEMPTKHIAARALREVNKI